jgi:hypothetical protein
MSCVVFGFSCVVFGFAVGAVPAGVLAWPMQHPELHTSASVDGVPTIINGVNRALAPPVSGESASA